jgi:hypothetical protein
MLEILHDEIDDHESLRDEAAACVESVKAAIDDHANGSTDFHQILTGCAAALADELDEVTTKAVRTGLAHAKRRAQKLSAAKGQGEYANDQAENQT